MLMSSIVCNFFGYLDHPKSIVLSIQNGVNADYIRLLSRVRHIARSLLSSE